MKKVLLASLLVFSMMNVMQVNAKECNCPPDAHKEKPHVEGHNPPPQYEKAKNDFETRLKLSDKQKEQARVIRQKGHEQMKPVMDKMFALKKEKNALLKKGVKETDASVEKINNEMRELRKKMHEIRKANMEEFEAILTSHQKKELEKMKQEAKNKYKKNGKYSHKSKRKHSKGNRK